MTRNEGSIRAGCGKFEMGIPSTTHEPVQKTRGTLARQTAAETTVLLSRQALALLMWHTGELLPLALLCAALSACAGHRDLLIRSGAAQPAARPLGIARVHSRPARCRDFPGTDATAFCNNTVGGR